MATALPHEEQTAREDLSTQSEQEPRTLRSLLTRDNRSVHCREVGEGPGRRRPSFQTWNSLSMHCSFESRSRKRNPMWDCACCTASSHYSSSSSSRTGQNCLVAEGRDRYINTEAYHGMKSNNTPPTSPTTAVARWTTQHGMMNALRTSGPHVLIDHTVRTATHTYSCPKPILDALRPVLMAALLSWLVRLWTRQQQRSRLAELPSLPSQQSRRRPTESGTLSGYHLHAGHLHLQAIPWQHLQLRFTRRSSPYTRVVAWHGLRYVQSTVSGREPSSLPRYDVRQLLERRVEGFLNSTKVPTYLLHEFPLANKFPSRDSLPNCINYYKGARTMTCARPRGGRSDSRRFYIPKNEISVPPPSRLVDIYHCWHGKASECSRGRHFAPAQPQRCIINDRQSWANWARWDVYERWNWPKQHRCYYATEINQWGHRFGKSQNFNAGHPCILHL